MNDDYEDIINQPHPVSKNHSPMPLSMRAAQFAPFESLSGFHNSIRAKGDYDGAAAEEQLEENYLSTILDLYLMQAEEGYSTEDKEI